MKRRICTQIIFWQLDTKTYFLNTRVGVRGGSVGVDVYVRRREREREGEKYIYIGIYLLYSVFAGPFFCMHGSL